ncbi:MAG: hypothetical protein AB7L84_15880 [Acidimicrobiia bacterium]
MSRDPSTRGGPDGPVGPDDPDDAVALARYAGALAAGVVAALPGWVERCVELRWRQWCGGDAGEELRAAARRAGRAAVAQVEPELRALLATDVDAQRANPLALVRGSVRHPTQVLRAAGVPPVERDEQAATLFPDDDYDLAPAAFADLDPALADLGLAWGAAKAHVVLARRRREGRR